MTLRSSMQNIGAVYLGHVLMCQILCYLWQFKLATCSFTAYYFSVDSR